MFVSLQAEKELQDTGTLTFPAYLPASFRRSTGSIWKSHYPLVEMKN